MQSAHGAHTFLSFILDAIDDLLTNFLKMSSAQSWSDVLLRQ